MNLYPNLFLNAASGIYRAVPMRVSPIQSNVKSVYKTHIDAIHFRKTDEKRLHGLDEETEQKLFTEDRMQTLRELAAKPDVYERLSAALAPSIYEHEDIKKVGVNKCQQQVHLFSCKTVQGTKKISSRLGHI